MIIHDLIQGTPEWLAHRRNYHNASDAPAMLGESKHKTRTEFLHERFTGITKDVDNATQGRFDDGHRCERLARPYAEKIIGEELFPVTGSNGKYSASFDGITMSERILLEHKRINDELRACTCAADLPLMYRIQMEQQLMVSENGEKVLFMASNWDRDGELIEEVHFWYEPDFALRERIISGWDQFEKDLAEYVPVEIAEKPKAVAVESFPVPSISVRGELVACNLKQITPRFDKFLADTKTALTTDDDFAEGEANAKVSREAAKNLRLTAKAVVDQIAPVSEAVRTLEQYADKFDALGLKLEKAVKDQKESIKANAITDAKLKFVQTIQLLEEEIQPIKLNIQAPDFATAIKGLKTIKSLHDRINTTLANAKADAESAARDIRTKLNWYKFNANGFEFLFADLQQIISKPSEDFGLLVRTRINDHQVAEKKREDEIKAKAEADAQAKVEADARAAEEAGAMKEAATIEATLIADAPSANGVYIGLDQAATDGDTTSVVLIQPAKEAKDNGNKLKIGQLNAMLGFVVNEAFLKSLGFDAEKDRSAALYRECDFPAICKAIALHVLKQAELKLAA